MRFLGLFTWLALELVCALPSSYGQFFTWGDNTYGLTNPPAFTTNIVSLASGDDHAIALLADRSVAAWGAFNWNGAVSPVQVPGDAMPAAAIGGAEVNGYSILEDGTFKIWGYRFFYDGSPTNVPPQTTNILAASAGPPGQFALALRADGNIVAWGNYQYGAALTNIPAEARHIVQVSAASWDAVALRSDGRVIAWGINSAVTNVPAAATNIVAIATGYRHCAALRSDGRVVSWGTISPYFFSGTISPPPTSATNVTDIRSGGGHALALRNDGKVVVWGNNTYGQLNLPATATNLTHVAGSGKASFAIAGVGAPIFYEPSVARTVASGRSAFLRLVASGKYPISYQWSFMGTNLPNATNSFLAITNATLAHAGFYTLTASNAFGTATRTNLQLNVEPVIIYNQPVSQPMYVGGTVTLSATVFGASLTYQWQLNGTNIVGATNLTLVLSNIQTTNAGAYTLAVSNATGSATSAPGIVTVAPMLLTAQPTNIVWFPGGVATIGVAVQSASALSYQWRRNGFDLLGATNSSLVLSNLIASNAGAYDVVIRNAIATTNSNAATLSLVPIAAWGSSVAVIPAGATNVSKIRSNRNGARAALTSDGRIIYWGNSGGMTNGMPSDLSDIVDFAMVTFTTIGLRSNGQVVVWGSNSFGVTNVPPGISDATAVAAGQNHFLVLRSDGTVVAWGGNTYGQTNVPPWLTNVIGIASFDLHSLALTADGRVASWGRNSDGQTNVPISLSNVVAIAAGTLRSAALKEDGNLVVWGSAFGNPQNIPESATNLVMITADMPMLALRGDGNVVIWGSVMPFEQVLPPAGLANVSAITTGGGSYMALVGEPSGLPILPFLDAQLTLAGFSVSIPTESGRVYRLEYKNSLTNTNWTALPLVAGTGKLCALTDASATNSQQRFYRVRQW
jgi:alpha-tubulin suppressor-like RCC1 family protein